VGWSRTTGPNRPRRSEQLTPAQHYALESNVRALPGSILDATADRVIVWRPDWPIPGPNGVRRVSCSADRLPAVIAEVRSQAAERGVRLSWQLDVWNRAELEPVLLAHGLHLDDEVTTLEFEGDVEEPPVTGLELADGMADLETFRRHHAAVAEGFEGIGVTGKEGEIRQRFAAAEAAGVRLVTALVFGEPAGGGSLVVEADGATLGGASVLPRFRHRGIYRALVAERTRLAAEQGAPLVITHARPPSRPILEWLGFAPIGRWWSYLEASG
jgi:GNAT superfamily N-acetyltransferase